MYDYFLKDHLGNIRSTVTEQQKTDAYPPASLETANINNEKIYYSGLDNGIVNKSTVTNYPTNDTYTSPNDFIQKLRGDGTKIGAGIFLKVMAGDKLNVQTGWWYRLAGADPANTASPLTDIVAALSAGIPGVSSNKVLQSQLTTTVLNPTATSFLTSRDANTNTARPRAWLNIMVFDEQMNLVNTNDGKNSYYQQVAGGNTASVQYMTVSQREITKSGYVYVYVSNESTDVNVYFDNLQITQVRSALLQEQAYYPFGLEMKGISSQAAGASNNYKFNGGVEINESFDVDYYETSFRRYDMQIGRFTGVDMLAEETWHLTPYQFGANDPISYNDPTGLMFTTVNKNSSSATPHIDAWKGRDAHVQNALGDYTLSWVTMFGAFSAGLTSSGGGYVTSGGFFVPYTQQQQAQVATNMSAEGAVRHNYLSVDKVYEFSTDKYRGELLCSWGIEYNYTGPLATSIFHEGMSQNTGVGFNDGSSWLDNLQTTLDVAGVADQTGITDGINAVIYLCRGDWKNALISAIGIVPVIGDAAKMERLGLKAAKTIKNIKTALPTIDATGKVHGILPLAQDLYKYAKEELEILLTELKQSVQKRIEVTSRLGRDKSHGERQGEEQDLIKSLEKYLGAD